MQFIFLSYNKQREKRRDYLTTTEQGFRCQATKKQRTNEPQVVVNPAHKTKPVRTPLTRTPPSHALVVSLRS